jgi:hypothetical protein
LRRFAPSSAPEGKPLFLDRLRAAADEIGRLVLPDELRRKPVALTDAPEFV